MSVFFSARAVTGLIRLKRLFSICFRKPVLYTVQGNSMITNTTSDKTKNYVVNINFFASNESKAIINHVSEVLLYF